MKEHVYKGNKIIEYKEENGTRTFCAYYLNADGDIDHKAFDTLKEAKAFLDKREEEETEIPQVEIKIQCDKDMVAQTLRELLQEVEESDGFHSLETEYYYAEMNDME